MTKNITILMNRDSVCAADDFDSHEKSFSLKPPLTIESLLLAALNKINLPMISGGEATWIIRGPKPLAIKLQSESELKILVQKQLDASSLLDESGKIKLHFEYQAQKSPHSLGYKI